MPFLDISFIPRKPVQCAFQVHCARRATKHVLNFDRGSVGIKKLQTDPSALQELKAAWGNFSLLSVRGISLNPIPIPSASFTQVQGSRAAMFPFSQGSREVSWKGHRGKRPGALPPTCCLACVLPFADFLQSRMRKPFVLSGFLLYLPLYVSYWWLWKRWPCFCNLDITGNLLSTEPSEIPAYAA